MTACIWAPLVTVRRCYLLAYIRLWISSNWHRNLCQQHRHTACPKGTCQHTHMHTAAAALHQQMSCSCTHGPAERTPSKGQVGFSHSVMAPSALALSVNAQRYLDASEPVLVWASMKVTMCISLFCRAASAGVWPRRLRGEGEAPALSSCSAASLRPYPAHAQQHHQLDHERRHPGQCSCLVRQPTLHA